MSGVDVTGIPSPVFDKSIAVVAALAKSMYRLRLPEMLKRRHKLEHTGIGEHPND